MSANVATHPEPPPSFELFSRLPHDIRLIIYSHFFRGLVVAIDEPLNNVPESAILRCTGLISHEATSIFYQLVYFRVDRQDFYDLTLGLSPTTARLSQMHDLARICNVVVTNFEVNEILYDFKNFSATDLCGLRKVVVDMEVCSCGPAHFSIRRRSCAQCSTMAFLRLGQPIPRDERSYATKTVLNNLEKLQKQMKWMRNAKGYEVEINMVMMRNNGEVTSPKEDGTRRICNTAQKREYEQVAVLMITSPGIRIIEGEKAVAEEARDLLVDQLHLYNEKTHL